MLTIAVGMTLIGFVLLVVALMQSSFWLAIGCIVVCVVGLLILLYDTLRANKRGRGGVEDEPLFTIRGRESAARAEPLIADADDAAGAQSADIQSTDIQSADIQSTDIQSADIQSRGEDFDTGRPGARAADDATEVVAPVTQGYTPTWESDAAATPGLGSPGLGSIVSPDAHGSAVGDTSSQAPAEETGDANDYIRSVTGSFPVQTGRQQAAAPGADASTPASGSFETPSDAAPTGAEDVDPDQYVGRRRRIEQSENLVVNTSDPTLPAMQFVYRDNDGADTGERRAEAPPSDTAPAEAPSDDESDNR
ncbi:hypothetical protein L5G28_13905 [Gordonia sp. HY285]|uniref:hypothetical protein n=1 Tax=Gordonia liuliyuniae TaxID=2911517 RepID=UPI001F2339FA|nr:hypothetical protein [Gordonia liuliyuniae]MCF8611241.1 hypothetical protein [Gordonia liuliyuniae]